jgi:type I restriction enzyme, S subunit
VSWATATLAEVATIDRRSVQASAIVAGTRYVGLEHIASGGSMLSFAPVANGELASNKFAFGVDHILFGKLRPYLAKIVCPDFDGICSTDILPIKPGKHVTKRYLMHFLKLPATVEWASSRATGVNLPRLSPSELALLEIPLPPLDEQWRIAAILDKADALRQKRKRAIALLDSMTQAIFLEMFGELRSNSKGWNNVLPLIEVADVQSGITKGRKINGKPTRDVPYMAVSNVQDKSLDLSVIKTIEATDQEIARFRLQRGDLLLTEGGDPDKLGRGTLWNDELPEAIHQNHIFRVRVTSLWIIVLQPQPANRT